MAKTAFDSVFVCDKAFYRKHIRTNTGVMIKLMRININSKEHPRNHVRMSAKCMQELVTEDVNLRTYSDMFNAAIKKMSEPQEIEVLADEIDRAVRHGINAISFSPNKCTILTTAEQLEKYKSNPHNKMASLIVLSDEEALYLIDRYFDLCMAKDAY